MLSGKIFSSSARNSSRALFHGGSSLNTTLANVEVTANAPVDFKEALPFESIPGPSNWPVVKGIPWFYTMEGLGKERAQEVLFACFRKYGSIWKAPDLPFREGHTVALYKPESIREVFQHEGLYPERDFLNCVGVYRKLNPDIYKNDGVAIANGKSWADIRSKVQPVLMRVNEIEPYLKDIDSISLEFADNIKKTKNIQGMVEDFYTTVTRWTLEMAGMIALNTKLGCLDPDIESNSEAFKMINSAKNFQQGVIDLDFNVPLYKLFATAQWNAFVEAQRTIERIGLRYINVQRNKIEETDTADRSVMKSLLNKMGLDASESIVMLLDMMIAGIDTTGSTLTFNTYCLASHPEYQKKVYDEINTLFPDKNQPLALNKLRQMTYLKASIKEALRLFPIFDVISRRVKRDIVIEGYQIPKNTTCALAAGISGLLQENFDDPHSFIPERWVRGSPQQCEYPKYSYLPFGSGSRMCVGKNLAEIQLLAGTTRLLQNFHIEYDGPVPEKRFKMVNIPHGHLRFKFIERT